jgi:hypothetical protein
MQDQRDLRARLESALAEGQRLREESRSVQKPKLYLSTFLEFFRFKRLPREINRHCVKLIFEPFSERRDTSIRRPQVFRLVPAIQLLFKNQPTNFLQVLSKPGSVSRAGKR